MQNLPIIAATPAPSHATPPTQVSNSSDNSTAQATEPFGNVLARQRANAGASQDSQKSDSKQAASSSAANDAATTAASNDPATQAQAPAPDASAAIPGAMLAALLPSTAGTDIPATATKDKTIPQAPTPDGVSTLPSDMLGMMMPAATAATAATATTAATAAAAATAATTADAAAANRIAANEKGLQVSATDIGKKAQPLPIATTPSGETLQPAKSKTTSGGAAIPSGIAALFPAQASAKPEVAITGSSTNKDNTFAAALGTLSKDGAKTTQADTGAMKISAQPVAPTAMDSLMQSGVAPMAASQSGVAQVAQAVINTPVTDKAWGGEFNQKITWMATQHEQTAELHLNPPNLGPLDVVLKVSGDQATALFTSPHAAVRDAVEQALPQLRDMLAGNGITLGNATVSDQSPRDQQAWQASQQQKGNGGTTGTIDTTVATESITSVATASRGSRHLGMVDTFA